MAIALALPANIVSEHGSDDEVLLRRKAAERASVHKEADGLHALPTAEEKIGPLSIGRRLREEVDLSVAESFFGIGNILVGQCAEHHAAHAFFELVYMVHEYAQIAVECLRLHCSDDACLGGMAIRAGSERMGIVNLGIVPHRAEYSPLSFPDSGVSD